MASGRTWLKPGQVGAQAQEQGMVYSFPNTSQADRRPKEWWIIVLDVFVPGLRGSRMCVLQRRKPSQNRFSMRLLTEMHWNGGYWDHIAVSHEILEFEGGCVYGIGIFLFPKHALLGAGQRNEGESLGTASTVVLWCVICQSSFHLIPLMSSDPLIFIFVSVVQRIKRKSHSSDVPGGPFWAVSLVLESTRALPAADPSWPACFSYPKEEPHPGIWSVSRGLLLNCFQTSKCQ